MELKSSTEPLTFIYVDEASFNMAKIRRHGSNVIGHRAKVQIPGQRGANITMCTAISEPGPLTSIPAAEPYNSGKLIEFLDGLYRAPLESEGRKDANVTAQHYAVIWDNVLFHHTAAV